MQFQIECNLMPSQQQFCSICNHWFEMTEARVIIRNDQGSYYGEVCPECLKQGFNWLSDRFEQINQPKRKVILRSTRIEIPIGA